MLERVGTYTFPSGHTNPIWKCECSCGNMVEVLSKSLRSGWTTSCGCAQREAVTKHGGSYDRLYCIWSGAKSRCCDNNNKNYEQYGGRGIQMRNEWIDNYSSFKEWALANGYNDNAEKFECTLDRIDPNKGYSPDNCRFVSIKEQQNNRRNNRVYMVNNERKTLTQLSEEYGINYATLQSRLDNGWSLEESLSRPVKEKNRSCVS